MWFFFGSKCAILIDTLCPPDWETNLVIVCLFFYVVLILKKYRNAVWTSIKMSYGKDGFLNLNDEGT